mgnify:CR=1 FL=1|tara:strand:- start:1822 stop:2862 length:1041 start_codon:yes stop_codon:yes gene_type:complete
MPRTAMLVHELPNWVQTVLSMSKTEAASALMRNSAWRDELPKLPVEVRSLVAKHMMPEGMEKAALSKHEADAARGKAMNMIIMIEGLSTRPDLNMRVAKVIVPPKTPDDKRVGVQLLESGEKVRVHEDKLIPMEPDDVDGEIACMMNPMDRTLFARHHGLTAVAPPSAAEAMQEALTTMKLGATGVWSPPSSPPSSLPGSPRQTGARVLEEQQPVTNPNATQIHVGVRGSVTSEVPDMEINVDYIYAYLGVRGSVTSDVPDMEINVDYTGKYADHHGKVELFFRESRYAGYDVFRVVCDRLTQLDVPFLSRSSHEDGSFSGGEGQVFLEQLEFARLCEAAVPRVVS